MSNVNIQRRIAIISVSDKEGLAEIGKWLINSKLELVASEGTAAMLRDLNLKVDDVSSITKCKEMLDGRVKTLHPAIHGGILAQNTESHLNQLAELEIPFVEVVVCNVYPFRRYVTPTKSSPEKAMDNIDIGGVTLLRSAAKNHSRVLTLCDPSDYSELIAEYPNLKLVTEKKRKEMALKAFTYTAEYDLVICDYFRKTYFPKINQYNLRYGMNPHQTPAQIFVKDGDLPFTVLNGAPGYINLCDAFNAWQLVTELSDATDLPAAASFKHLSPAGAAVGSKLDKIEARAYFVKEELLDSMSLIAAAYARARGADRISSFGDFIALSDRCDVITAKLISAEVSDGIIAPSYEDEALDILRKKKKGAYCILEMAVDYEPDEMERSTIFGMILEQKRNQCEISFETLDDIISENKFIPEEVKIDLLVAAISVKYTQSNSVCLAVNGQLIGVGAGQQSRIHCTRLAADKSYMWRMRQFPPILNLDFKDGVKRAEKSSAIDNLINKSVGVDISSEQFNSYFKTVPSELCDLNLDHWYKKGKSISMASDAFFPFRDCIDRANYVGVKYVISPSGSVNDEIVKKACNEHKMVLINTDFRLFHH